MPQQQLHIASHIAPAPVGGIAEEIWYDLLEGNQRFCTGEINRHRLVAERESLVAGQHPKAIVLGCSDSRVSPEIVFDQSLGDLFVVRAAGNVLDSVGLGSMEYAVEHLGTRLIVILGHDRCGAVQAACAEGNTESPYLRTLLSELRPVVRECHQKTGAALIREVVEHNARRVSDLLLTRSSILHSAFERGTLQLIAARYDLFSGEVIRLN